MSSLVFSLSSPLPPFFPPLWLLWLSRILAHPFLLPFWTVAVASSCLFQSTDGIYSLFRSRILGCAGSPLCSCALGKNWVLERSSLQWSGRWTATEPWFPKPGCRSCIHWYQVLLMQMLIQVDSNLPEVLALHNLSWLWKLLETEIAYRFKTKPAVYEGMLWIKWAFRDVEERLLSQISGKKIGIFSLQWFL